MTCQEFAALCERFDSTTIGERAAALRHALECEQCERIVHEGVKEDVKKGTLTPSDIAEIDALISQDEADPEFWPTALGK